MWNIATLGPYNIAVKHITKTTLLLSVTLLIVTFGIARHVAADGIPSDKDLKQAAHDQAQQSSSRSLPALDEKTYPERRLGLLEYVCLRSGQPLAIEPYGDLREAFGYFIPLLETKRRAEARELIRQTVRRVHTDLNNLRQLPHNAHIGDFRIAALLRAHLLYAGQDVLEKEV